MRRMPSTHHEILRSSAFIMSCSACPLEERLELFPPAFEIFSLAILPSVCAVSRQILIPMVRKAEDSSGIYAHVHLLFAT